MVLCKAATQVFSQRWHWVMIIKSDNILLSLHLLRCHLSQTRHVACVNHLEELLRTHATRAGKVGELPSDALPGGTTVNSEELWGYFTLWEKPWSSPPAEQGTAYWLGIVHTLNLRSHYIPFNYIKSLWTWVFTNTVIKKQVLPKNQSRTENKSANVQCDFKVWET